MREFRKVLFAGFVGGIAIFTWGIVSWTFFPWHEKVWRTLPQEERVAEALLSTGAPRGVYVLPGRPSDAEADQGAIEEWDRRIRRGPVAFLVYRPEGVPPNRMFRPLTRGLVVSFLIATLAAEALRRSRPRRYLARVGFVLGIGAFAWLVGPVMQWAWFQYPDEWIWSALIDAACGWLIIGFVQAGIVRP